MQVWHQSRMMKDDEGKVMHGTVWRLNIGIGVPALHIPPTSEETHETQ